MKTRFIRSYLSKFVLLISMLALTSCTQQSEIEIIRAISMLPKQTDYTRDFEQWVNEVNKLGEGKFKIQPLGLI